MYDVLLLLYCRLPLSLMKSKIKKNLQNLELSEMVTRKNGYQDLVNMIAQVRRTTCRCTGVISVQHKERKRL